MSIIVSQDVLYDEVECTNHIPCGLYQVWDGRPLGRFRQMLGLGRNQSYGDYMAPTVSPDGTRLVYSARDGSLMIANLNASTSAAARSIRSWATGSRGPRAGSPFAARSTRD